MIENTKNSFDKLRSFKNNIEFQFLYTYKKIYQAKIKSQVYCFEIWEGGRESEEKFTCNFKIMENDEDIKLIDLFPPDYYRGKGISIAIILKAKELFNKRIISSSNIKRTFIGEMRWKDATEKVWKRMVDDGIASFDPKNDIFYTLK